MTKLTETEAREIADTARMVKAPGADNEHWNVITTDGTVLLVVQRDYPGPIMGERYVVPSDPGPWWTYRLTAMPDARPSIYPSPEAAAADGLGRWVVWVTKGI